jgi:hypothetical protein
MPTKRSSIFTHAAYQSTPCIALFRVAPLALYFRTTRPRFFDLNHRTKLVPLKNNTKTTPTDVEPFADSGLAHAPMTKPLYSQKVSEGI